MKETLKRTIGILLALLMIAGMFPVSVFAEEAEPAISTDAVESVAEEIPASAEVPEAEAGPAPAEVKNIISNVIGPLQLEEEEAPVLVEQIVNAAIFTDDSYATEAQDVADLITISGQLPEGTVAYAYPVDVTLEDMTVLFAYDIKLFTVDEAGELTEYQPGEENPVNVSIATPKLTETTDAADGQTETAAVEVFHMEDIEDAAPEAVTAVETESGALSFQADSFSIYVAAKKNKSVVIIDKYKVTAHSADSSLQDIDIGMASTTFEYAYYLENADGNAIDFTVAGADYRTVPLIEGFEYRGAKYASKTVTIPVTIEALVVDEDTSNWQYRLENGDLVYVDEEADIYFIFEG